MMETKLEVKLEEPSPSQARPEKAHQKFQAVEHHAEYSPSWSSTFQKRSDMLWTIILGDHKAKNEARWAKCCYTLERKGQKGRLGHPKELVVPACRLLTEHSIKTKDNLYEYLVKHLPRNEKGDSRLPQINMRHPLKIENDEDITEPPQHTCRCKAEALDTKLLGLEAEVADLSDKNTDLKQELSDLRTSFLVY